MLKGQEIIFSEDLVSEQKKYTDFLTGKYYSLSMWWGVEGLHKYEETTARETTSGSNTH